MLSSFDTLYGTRVAGRNAGIDAAYSPPARFAHAERARVARFAGQGDGRDVEVYERRCPASFWTVKVTDGPAGRGFCLATGSGLECGRLAFAIARAVAEGTLRLLDAPLAHTEAARVARFDGEGDGQDVELYEEEQGSASFWTIEALDTPGSIGAVNEGFCLTIGNGTLAFAIAEAVSEGMLGLGEAG